MIAPPHRDISSAVRAAQAPDQAVASQRDRVTGRHVDMLLRGLGVILPLGFGLLLLDLPLASPNFPLPVTITIVALIGLIGGALLRLRRATLIVPAAFLVGLGIGHVVHGWILSRMTVSALVVVMLYVLLLWCMPLIVGAAGGLPLGIWLEERIQRARRTRITLS